VTKSLANGELAFVIVTGRIGRMKLRFALLAVALIAASLSFTACTTDTYTNRNANTNANLATPQGAASPPSSTRELTRAEYTEEKAREARDRAKQTGETIGDTLDDAWIHTKIVAKLIADADTPERKINVDVVNNAVTLRGTVDTAEARVEAERIAKETEGVKSVTNQLKVTPAAKGPAKAKP
jgi:hypothetical protein